MRKKAKKIAALMCAAAIISAFTGCTAKEPVSTPTDAHTSNTIQTEISSTAAQNNAPVFMLEELPEIGDYVEDIVYKRRYPETRETLTPGEDYGRLIPFVGSFRDYHFVDYETGEWKDGTYPVSKYGLMTDKGEIVVDAVYDYVDIIPCADGSYIIELSKNGEEFETVGERLICSSDGSWVKNGAEYVYYTHEAGVDDIFVVVDQSEIDWDNSTGAPKTIFYDKNGKKLFEFESCSPCDDGSFHNGYIALDFFSDYQNYECETRFVDRNGNFAFDGVYPQGNFEDGIVIARKKGTAKGLFSAEGEWIVLPLYDGIYKEGNGYIAYNNTYHVVFDKNGETVKIISNSELGDKQINLHGDRIFYSYNDYSKEKVESYFTDSETNELIYCKETNTRVTAYIPETEYFYCDDGTHTYIVNMDGNTVAKLKGAGTIRRIDDDFFSFTEGNEEDDYQTYSMYYFKGFKKLWSQQLKNTGDRISIWEYDGFLVKVYTPEGEYGEIVTHNGYDLLSTETGEPIFESITNYYTFKINGEIYYCIGDGTYTYTYAPDMTLLMKVRNERND